METADNKSQTLGVQVALLFYFRLFQHKNNDRWQMTAAKRSITCPLTYGNINVFFSPAQLPGSRTFSGVLGGKTRDLHIVDMTPV